MNLCVTYNSRINREAFWKELLKIVSWAVLAIFPFALLFSIFSPSIAQLNFVFYVLVLILIWPLASAFVRRLHDIGLSGWLFIVVFLPLICFRIADIFILLTVILGLIKSSGKDNQYEHHSPMMETTKKHVDRSSVLSHTVVVMGLASIIMVLFVLGNSMNPDANILHSSTIELDLSTIDQSVFELN